MRSSLRPDSSLLVLLVAPLAVTTALAGNVTGRVVDADTGRPLQGAEVRIDGSPLRTITDRSGTFRLNDVPAGSRTLTVGSTGFQAGSVTATVPETGSITQDVTLRATRAGEEILVVGYRAAQASALQDKRSSDVIKDSVLADDIGKLPDQNATEALQRVPGISITIDQGEGRYVTVRGIDASFNNTTIDGQIIGAPEGGERRVALDTVPTEILSKLEVIKTVTPDLDGNAIGGTVNIVTPSAFDAADGRFLSMSADYGYYDLNGENPWGAGIGWGQVFGEDNPIGVVLAASYSYRDYASENVQGNVWEEEGDFFIPEELVLRDYNLERERLGLVANFEYRPGTGNKLFLRNLYNRFTDTETRAETLYDYINGDLVDQTPTSGTFTEGEGERALKFREERQSIFTSTLGGEFERDAWTIGVSGTLGRSEQDTPFDNEWVFELGNELPMSYDTSRFFFGVDAGPEFNEPGNWEFKEVERASQIVKEDLQVLQLDLRRDLQWRDRPGYLKFGGKYTSREKTSDENTLILDGFEDDFLLSSVFRPGKGDFYCSERCYTFGPVIDYGAAEQFLAANRGGFEEDTDGSIEASFTTDYSVDEDVAAGYLMGGLDIGSLTLTGGVRVEHTSSRYSAFEVVLDDGDLTGAPTRTTGRDSYTNWLPSLVARWEVRNDLVARAAFTNTIGRPSYETIVPFRVSEFEEVDPGEFEGELVIGNPALKPLESMNLDASLEWYLEPVGIMGIGVFYKDIDNPIFIRVSEFENIDFEDGRFYQELAIEQAQNGSSGDIFGIELNFQRQFQELPAPFNGLGVSLNYTYTDSDAKVFDREGRVPFFRQSDHIGNAAVFYQIGSFEARLALAHRSEYLEELGDDAETDIYVDDRTQVDFKASYRFPNRLTVALELLNITDEPLRVYSGRGDRLAENEIYSWNAVLGVQYQF